MLSRTNPTLSEIVFSLGARVLENEIAGTPDPAIHNRWLRGYYLLEYRRAKARGSATQHKLLSDYEAVKNDRQHHESF